MRWPLRNQLVAPLLGIAVAAVILVSGLDAYFAARRSARQIVAQLDQMAETLRDSNFPLTDAVLTQVRGLSGVEVVVVDARGQVVAASLEPAARAAFQPPATSPADPLDSTVQVAERRYFDRVIDRVYGGDEPERLHLLYPERIYRENLWSAAFPSLAVGLATLLAVTVAAGAWSVRLSRPIGKLRNQVVRIAAGDYSPVPLPTRDDELRDLAVSVNRLAERLSDLSDSLRRGERLALLGQLSGGLAHQLRNSIAGAKIAMQLHQRGCAGTERQSLEVALRQLALTEEHLLSFLSAGQPRPIVREDVDFRHLVDETLKLVEPMAKHRRVELRSELEGHDLRLSVDPGQVRELLLNLLLNAIEANEPGGWVEVSVQAGPLFQFEVRDGGPGPPPELCERLFEPFVTGKPEGIGLGLAAARRIAETHGGSLRRLDVRPTTFRCELPRESPKDTA